MTLDDRGRRAGGDVRRTLAGAEDRAHDDAFERFERFRAGRARAQRGRAILLAAVVTAAAVLLLTRAFPPADRRRPANPPIRNGAIVFGRSAPGIDGRRLFTVDPDGAHELALPVTFTDCAEWSPDGTRLHITTSEYPGAPLRPGVVAADGTGLRLLAAITDPSVGLGCGDWSPDGRRFALEGLDAEGLDEGVDKGVRGIYTVRSSDGGDLVRLTTAPEGESDDVPQYAPDGTDIAFLRTAPDRPGNVGAIFLVHPDGSDLRRVSPPGLAVSSGSWSPDGEWIAFAGVDAELYLIHPDGSGLRTVPLGLVDGRPQQPRWAPDGTALVFTVQIKDTNDVYTVRPDGSDLLRITNTPDADELWPDWGRLPG